MKASLRLVAVPLMAYVLIAIVLPVLNGAAGRPEFVDHVWSIAAVCGVITAGVVTLHAALSRLGEKRRS